jgi:hypothetical protein
MKKEFVPYEIALELKELGFDEPCFGYYWIHDKELILNLNTPFQGYHKGFDGSISAPTFSQAFRWFREKQELDGIVYKSIEGTYYSWITKVGSNIHNHYEFCNKDLIYYKTYPEAELACLIKLIEIVKEVK